MHTGAYKRIDFSPFDRRDGYRDGCSRTTEGLACPAVHQLFILQTNVLSVRSMKGTSTVEYFFRCFAVREVRWIAISTSCQPVTLTPVPCCLEVQGVVYYGGNSRHGSDRWWFWKSQVGNVTSIMGPISDEFGCGDIV